MSPEEEAEHIPLLRTLLPELVRESPGSRVRLMDLFTELFHVAAAADKPFMPLGSFARCMRALGHPRATRHGEVTLSGLDWLDADLAAEIASNRAAAQHTNAPKRNTN